MSMLHVEADDSNNLTLRILNRENDETLYLERYLNRRNRNPETDDRSLQETANDLICNIEIKPKLLVTIGNGLK